MRFASILVLFAQAVGVNHAAAQPTRTPKFDRNGDPLPDGAVARLGSSRFRSSEGLGATALSPDGTTVARALVSRASGSFEDRIRLDLMDAATGKSVRQYALTDTSIEEMHFTPDGKSLFVSSKYGSKLIDAASGKDLSSFKFGEAICVRPAITRDAKWAAAQTHKNAFDAPVSLLDVQTGKVVASLPGLGASGKQLQFGPDGKRLLLWSIVPAEVRDGGTSYHNNCDAALACIDVEKRKIVGDVKVPSALSMALSPDGETVAFETAGHESVRVRHLPTGTDRCTIPARGASFAFSPDGVVLFTCDEGGQGVLWNATTGRKIRDLEGTVANKDFTIVGVSKDAKTVAVRDGGWHSDPVIVVWDGATGKQVERPPGHGGTVTCVAYGGPKLLASGSLDRTVRLWDPATGAHLRLLAVHKEAVKSVAISPDGALVASSCKSGATRLTRVADGKVVAEFTGPKDGATALAFSHDGQVLYAGGQESDVLAWKTAGGKDATRLTAGEHGAVLAFGDSGGLALTAIQEGRGLLLEPPEARLEVWSPAGKRRVATSPLRDENKGTPSCGAAVFSPDGRTYASSQISSYEGVRPSYGAAQLRLWEKETGQPIRTLAPTITEFLAFSHNGRLLAAGKPGRSGHLQVGYGAGIDVWDTITGERAGELPVTPHCVAFSPDGSHLATGGRDHSVLIWAAPATHVPKSAKAPTAAEREAWMTALKGEARDAYKAIGEMLAAPDHAVALVKGRVRPVQLGDPAVVSGLIKQLGSEEFMEREDAQKALERMGEGVSHLLAKAQTGETNPEVLRRVGELLRKAEATSAQGLQHKRAVAVLEWVGTPDATDLLRTLADGAPRSRLTIEAQAALRRLPR